MLKTMTSIMTWGKRKDGQAYNKDKKGMSGSGQSTAPTSDVHMKEKEFKRWSNSKLEDILDVDVEDIYLVKGMEVTPEIDSGKEIPSYVVLHSFNMLDATGDEKFEKKPWITEVLLVPHEDVVRDQVKNEIFENYDTSYDRKEFFIESMVRDGYTVRLDEENGKDPDKMKDELAKTVEKFNLIGFFLDKAQNDYGRTGWDFLRDIVG